MASVYYYEQIPLVFHFNLICTKKAKPESILVVVVKLRHRANGISETRLIQSQIIG